MSMDNEKRRQAKQIAEARYDFWWHLPIYVIVNLTLVAVWYYNGAGFPWPIFPIFLWGLGVLAHYMSAFRSSGGGWIERETEKILREEEKGKA